MKRVGGQSQANTKKTPTTVSTTDDVAKLDLMKDRAIYDYFQAFAPKNWNKVLNVTLLLGIQVVGKYIGTDVDHITLAEVQSLLESQKQAIMREKQNLESRFKEIEKKIADQKKNIHPKTSPEHPPAKVSKPKEKIVPKKETKLCMRHYVKPSSAWRDGTISGIKDVLFDNDPTSEQPASISPVRNSEKIAAKITNAPAPPIELNYGLNERPIQNGNINKSPTKSDNFKENLPASPSAPLFNAQINNSRNRADDRQNFQPEKKVRGGVAWNFGDALTPPAKSKRKADENLVRTSKTPPPRYGIKNKPKFRKPKFGLPYDVKNVESKIKDQVEYDRRYQQLLKQMKEPRTDTDSEYTSASEFDDQVTVVTDEENFTTQTRETDDPLTIAERFLSNALMNDFM